MSCSCICHDLNNAKDCQICDCRFKELQTEIGEMAYYESLDEPEVELHNSKFLSESLK